MKRFIGVLVLMGCLLRVASAGYYSISFSGGIVTWDAGSGPQSGLYTHNPITNSVSALRVGHTVQCAGTVTATCTWNGGPGNDLPPPVVVIEEKAGASFAPFVGTGAASTSLPIENGPATNVSSTHYSVKVNPGSSFTLQCTPTSSVSDLSNKGRAGVAYTVNVAIPTVQLEGGNGAGGYLIGQKMKATLGGIFALTVGDIEWAVEGGEPFGGWSANSLSAGPPLPLTLDEPELIAYFKEPANPATVEAEAHLDVPSGASPVNGLDIAVSGACSAEAPASVFLEVYSRQHNQGGHATGDYDSPPGTTHSIPSSGVALVWMHQPWAMGYVGIDTSLNTPPFNPPGTSSTWSVGTLWEGSVTTGAGWGGTGKFFFVQTLVPKREKWVGATQHVVVGYGQEFLDLQYPYSSQFDADGSANFSADAPAIAFSPAQVTKVVADDSFKTWMMFCPPGTGSVPVPLKKWTWSWSGTATLSGGVWGLSSTNSTYTMPIDYPDFPTWTGLVQTPSTWNPPL